MREKKRNWKPLDRGKEGRKNEGGEVI